MSQLNFSFAQYPPWQCPKFPDSVNTYTNLQEVSNILDITEEHVEQIGHLISSPGYVANTLHKKQGSLAAPRSIPFPTQHATNWVGTTRIANDTN